MDRKAKGVPEYKYKKGLTKQRSPRDKTSTGHA